jgi:hypothetical protein
MTVKRGSSQKLEVETGEGWSSAYLGNPQESLQCTQVWLNFLLSFANLVLFKQHHNFDNLIAQQ